MLVAVPVASVSGGSRTRPHGVGVIGHRGASALHPENTLGSMVAALEAGADGVEFDLHALADGTLVVLHDETLLRTALPGRHLEDELLQTPVARLTLDQVRLVDVGGGHAPVFAEMLKVVIERHPHALSFAELKAGFGVPEVHRAVQVVEEVGASVSQLVYISFDVRVCCEVKLRSPRSDVLLVAFCESEAEARAVINLAVARGIDGIDLNADPRIVTRALVEEAHAQGLLVAVWVNRAPGANDVVTVWDACFHNGVDFITSNLPTPVLPWAREANGHHVSRLPPPALPLVGGSLAPGGRDGRQTFASFWRDRHSVPIALV